MKYVIIVCFQLIVILNLQAQKIAINTSGAPADPSAILDISSQSKGILIPRLSQLQRLSMLSPANGLLVYDLTSNSFWYFSSGWHELTNGSLSGPASGDLSGSYPSPYVTKIQNRPVAPNAPSDKQVLKWDADQNSWQAMKDSLALPFKATAASATSVFSITNNHFGLVPSVAIHGKSIDSSGIFLSTSAGVWGDAYSGTGVIGTSNLLPGVWGQSTQSNGVMGQTSAATKSGIYGTTFADFGNAIIGESFAANANGVKGIAHTPQAKAVYGVSDAPVNGYGVYGATSPTDTLGIGVYGGSSSPALNKGGVYGYNASINGIGVNGLSPFGTGVYGRSQTFDGYGVRGVNDNSGVGVYGQGFGSYGGVAIGVKGKVYATDTISIGVQGSVEGNGGGDGVRGYAGGGGYGIAGYDKIGGGGTAGYFELSSTTSNAKTVTIKNNGIGEGLFIDATNATSSGTVLSVKKSGIGNYALFETGSGTHMIRLDNNGKGFFNGGTQTGGADIAEAFDVEADITDYEPGDVLEISTDRDRTVTKSSGPYSCLVAGVYATKPGVLMTEESIDTDISDKVPMGVVGVIPTKVCLEGGDIHRGDLLVTSSTPGVAMKGDPDKISPGQVLGKALEAYGGGTTGVIRVLVSVR